MSTMAGTAVVIDVAANDSDVDGNLDVGTVNTGCGGCTVPANGGLVNHGDGTFTYTPNPGFSGSDGFVYEICDTGGLCDTAAVSITVSAVNSAPVAVDDSVSTMAGTAVVIDVAANDSDVDGNLDVGTVNTGCGGCTVPANGGLVNHGDGTFTYTPNPGFSGSDGFVYEICDTGGLCDTAAVSITVSGGGGGGTSSLEVRVGASSDDAEERANGRVVLSSSDLELIRERDDQVVGIRFAGVAIPQGATIVNAYIQFTVDEATSEATNLTIQGEAADHASTFVNVDGNISGRPRTGASVAWVPPAWPTRDVAGPDQRTPNLAGVIQEVVNRPGWASGNALAIIITGSGKRVAQSYNKNPANAPLLHVEFSTDGAVNRAPVAVDDSVSTMAGTAVVIDVAANDSDVDGNLDVGTVNTGCGGCTVPANGGLVNHGDGTFTYTPNPGFSGSDGFVYEICDTGGLCDTAAVSITVSGGGGGGTSTVEVRVGASSDDAEERANGRVVLSSSDLELIRERDDQVVGIRFAGVAIPQGATIVNAYIQFTVDEATSEATNLTIQGEAADHASTFVNVDGNISGRPRTGASVAWVPPAWPTRDVAGPDQRTPNLAGVIQEVVNRPGWASGNALAIIITGSGKRVAQSYDKNPANAPLLHVEWSN
uniref:Tandem-95 repeat protein n=1 Tax=Litorilinea aerophila TaxID=1204385 RepID=A0A540V9H0_9CHLR